VCFESIIKSILVIGQSALVVSKLDSWLKGCGFESGIIQNTRWILGQSHARMNSCIQFWFIVEKIRKIQVFKLGTAKKYLFFNSCNIILSQQHNWPPAPVVSTFDPWQVKFTHSLQQKSFCFCFCWTQFYVLLRYEGFPFLFPFSCSVRFILNHTQHKIACPFGVSLPDSKDIKTAFSRYSGGFFKFEVDCTKYLKL